MQTGRRRKMPAMVMSRFFRRLLVVLTTQTVLASAVWAHDSWFETSATARAGELRLSLATGTLFPVQEGSVGEGAPVTTGCRHGSAVARPLRIVRDTPKALLMRAQIKLPPSVNASAAASASALGKAGHSAITCWAQLVPLEVTIAPEIVPNYLKEINASPELRANWAAMLVRGLPWKERYTKHARIELIDTRLGTGLGPVPQAAPMGMDIVMNSPGGSPQRGDEVTFTLLRDGQPLAGLPLELKSAITRLSFWTQTDSAGRATLRLPLAGRWLARAVDLRLSTTVPDEWESRFVTLAFEVR